MKRAYQSPREQALERGAITKLRLRMVERGELQYIVAARAGVSPSRVSEYAMGRRKIPSHHLINLAQALECSPDDLIGDYALGDSHQ